MNHLKTFSVLALACLTAIPAAAQSPVANAQGPVGPRPVGRSEWRDQTFRQMASFINWKIGAPASAFEGLTFLEAVMRMDQATLGYIEGSNKQWVSPEIRKPLDYNLTPAEITMVKNRLRKFHVQMVAYNVDAFGSDEAARRRVFEFAKTLGAELITTPQHADLAAIDQLAMEFHINVAIENLEPTALQGRSSRIGLRANSISAPPADKLMVLSVINSAAAKPLLEQLYRQNVKPLFITVSTTDPINPTADLARSVDALDEAMLPILGDYMVKRSKLLPIRGQSELSPEVKHQIEAAIPKAPPVKPAKPRKLLVMDARGGHPAIPHANYALELMGKSTGAFEAVFSNDLDNLKYDKIRQFDAVMLNSCEVDVSADPAVREGILRFVREGGGLGGLHAVSWSAAFWPEFMEMLGGSQGAHKNPQPATLKIDDPSSPLTKVFDGQEFLWTDEYYRMADTGLQGTYYSRDKLHVLLSIDLAKSPDFNAGRAPFVRKDNDYAVSWIRGYGKGRVFFNSLGHTVQSFTDPKMNEFLLAAMQFILGDLPADTTPSAELGAE
jgi:type 1 glutamine amidotransferase